MAGLLRRALDTHRSGIRRGKGLGQSATAGAFRHGQGPQAQQPGVAFPFWPAYRGRLDALQRHRHAVCPRSSDSARAGPNRETPYMRYLISYDLVDPVRDYPKLSTALLRLGGEHVLISQWLVTSPGTSAVELRDRLARCIDRQDRLLVTCIDELDWAGQNLMSTIPSRLEIEQSEGP